MKLTPEHVSSVLGSTTTDAPEIAAFLAHAMAVQASRAANGAASAHKRSERLRGAIRLACGVLPLHLPNAPNVLMSRLQRDPQRYGLRGSTDVPTDDLIRNEIKILSRSR